LCARPLAAADYLALAERFAAVVLEGHPAPGAAAAQRGAALPYSDRDAVRGARMFVASAEVPPEQIYVEGDGSSSSSAPSRRLMEMQSEDYVANRTAANGG
jgi:cell division protein ZapE